MFENIRKFIAKAGLKIMALAGQEYVGMQVRDWFGMSDASTITSANIYVNSDAASKTSAVYACLRILGGTAGSLPCQVFKRTADGGRELATKHPVYGLVHDKPSDLMSAFNFWKDITLTKHLHGNSYYLISRNGGGIPQALYPLDPANIRVERRDNRWIYVHTKAKGGREAFDQDDILDFPNLFLDKRTNKALSTITAGAQAIGLGLACERHAAVFFANAAVTSLALSFPGKVSPELKEEIKNYILSKTSGIKAHNPLVLSEGGKVESLTMKAEDAQLLQSREFQVEDICRFFGLPPWMVGSVSKTTSWGTGVEQQGIGFVVFAMGPELVMYEQEVNRKLLRDKEYFAEFNVTGLLRGDAKTRFASYRLGLGGNQLPGFMSKNEVRKLENYPPVEGGDRIYDPQEGGVANGQIDETLNGQ